jgi:hypothetical protein
MDESLDDGDARGRRFPCCGCRIPSTVFHGRKPGLSRTSDNGIKEVTPFLKASLLEFVSATMSPSIDAFASRCLVCGWRWDFFST